MTQEDGKFKIELPSGGVCECVARISKRARSASLRMRYGQGLELVVPRFYSLKKALGFAQSNAGWVERMLRRREELQELQPEQAPLEGKPALPSCLELKALGLTIPLEYLDSPKLGFVSVRFDKPDVLTVQGDLKDVELCLAALRDWLRRRALKPFKDEAEKLSKECGLDFKSLQVRDQRGRWGSCSRAGGICLNFRLLAMEPRFLRHVLIHELCHRAEMNHSARFWRLVESFEPDAKATRKELNREQSALPAWLRLGA